MKMQAVALSAGDIAQFFRDRADDLKRIARATRGDTELGDVQNEAWLVAADVERKRGYPVDFGVRADQETVIGTLYNRLVKFAEKHFRHAVRLDTDWDKDESTSFGAVLARLLTAPFSSRPAQGSSKPRMRQKRLKRCNAATRKRQPICFSSCGSTGTDRKSPIICALLLALGTLNSRLRLAGAKAAMQGSVFDGVEKIPVNFAPTMGLPRGGNERLHLAGEQREWRF